MQEGILGRMSRNAGYEFDYSPLQCQARDIIDELKKHGESSQLAGLVISSSLLETTRSIWPLSRIKLKLCTHYSLLTYRPESTTCVFVS